MGQFGYGVSFYDTKVLKNFNNNIKKGKGNKELSSIRENIKAF